MKKLHKKTLQTIITMSIMFVLIVTSYYFVRTSEGITITNTETEKTQTQLLIEEDINNKFPSTPKDVLELYIKISKSYYEKNTTEEQIDELAMQMILLFDEELLEKNPTEVYKSNLKSEIDGFRDKKIDVMNYLAGDNDTAEFWTKENNEYASRVVTYTLKEGSNYTKVYNTFILRRDDNGKWKILGWSSENSPIPEKTKE